MPTLVVGGQSPAQRQLAAVGALFFSTKFSSILRVLDAYKALLSALDRPFTDAENVRVLPAWEKISFIERAALLSLVLQPGLLNELDDPEKSWRRVDANIRAIVRAQILYWKSLRREVATMERLQELDAEILALEPFLTPAGWR